MSLAATALAALGIFVHKELDQRGWFNGYKGSTPLPDKTYIKKQVPKYQTRFTYSEGPMQFVAEQIVKEMQRMGHDAKVWCVYRGPDEQRRFLEAGTSKAKPWSSPHQYLEACDIIHRTKGWNVPRQFWLDLWACVQCIERRYSIDLVWGGDWDDDGNPVFSDPNESFWDPAHIQFADWKRVKKYTGNRKPNQTQLDLRFQEKLPQVWRSHLSSKAGQRGTHAANSSARLNEIRKKFE